MRAAWPLVVLTRDVQEGGWGLAPKEAVMNVRTRRMMFFAVVSFCASSVLAADPNAHPRATQNGSESAAKSIEAQRGQSCEPYSPTSEAKRAVANFLTLDLEHSGNIRPRAACNAIVTCSGSCNVTTLCGYSESAVPGNSCSLPGGGTISCPGGQTLYYISGRCGDGSCTGLCTPPSCLCGTWSGYTCK